MRLYRDQPSGTIARARDLRRNASEAQLRLLRTLKEAFAKPKRRHQTPFGSCSADLPCFSAKLLVEVGGATHANTPDHDVARPRFIEDEGDRAKKKGALAITDAPSSDFATIGHALPQGAGF